MEHRLGSIPSGTGCLGCTAYTPAGHGLSYGLCTAAILEDAEQDVAIRNARKMVGCLAVTEDGGGYIIVRSR